MAWNMAGEAYFKVPGVVWTMTGARLITNEMMKEYGVTQEQIHEDAMKSSPRVMVPEVSSIGAVSYTH